MDLDQTSLTLPLQQKMSYVYSIHVGNNPPNGSTRCIDIEESCLKPFDGWSIVLYNILLCSLQIEIFQPHAINRAQQIWK